MITKIEYDTSSIVDEFFDIKNKLLLSDVLDIRFI